jgi:hypothetical protein
MTGLSASETEWERRHNGREGLGRLWRTAIALLSGLLFGASPGYAAEYAFTTYPLGSLAFGAGITPPPRASMLPRLPPFIPARLAVISILAAALSMPVSKATQYRKS